MKDDSKKTDGPALTPDQRLEGWLKIEALVREYHLAQRKERGEALTVRP